MPQVPFTQEGQRLNPSSPVPIGSAESADMLQEATAQFGAAMFAAGDALDKAAARRKSEEERISLQIALNEARMEALKQKAIQEASPAIDQDYTGFGAVEQFQKRMDPFKKQINQRLGPGLSQKFESLYTDLVVDTATLVLATENKKRDGVLKSRRDQMISQYGQMVRMSDNPDRDLTEVMGIMEASILEDQDIAPADKEAMIPEGRKMLVEEAANGLASRGKFADAEVLVEKYGKFLPAEEKQKMVEGLQQSEYRANARELQRLEADEKRTLKYWKSRENNLVEGHFQSLLQAGNSEVLRRPIIQAIQRDQMLGKISDEKARGLLNPELFAKAADDEYEANIMARVVRGTLGVDAAIEKITNDRGLVSGGVSNDRAAELFRSLSMIKNRQRSDPFFIQRIQAGEDLIKSMRQPDIMALLNTMDQRNIEIKIQSAIGAFHSAMAANPAANPDAVAKSILRSKRHFNFDVSLMAPFQGGGRTGEFDEMTPQQIEAKRKQRAKEIQDMMKKGTLSKEKQKEFMKEDIRLKNKLNLLNSTQTPINPQDDDPAAVPAGGRRR